MKLNSIEIEKRYSVPDCGWTVVAKERLKELREEKGLSQSDIAKVLDMKYRQYHRYEQEMGVGSIITIEIIVKLACFYNVSADYILGLSDEKIKLYDVNPITVGNYYIDEAGKLRSII